MVKHWKIPGMALLMALCLGISAAVSGCGATLPIVSEVNNGPGYSDAQIMVVIATERNRYRSVYTDQIWDIEVDDEGTTFRSYLLNEVRTFMQELKTMNLLADEREIDIPSQDQEVLQQLTDEYFEGLTAQDIAYIGVTKEEVKKLYEEYHRASLLVDALTQNVNLEISDSEAKVITVQEVHFDSQEQAQQFYEAVTVNGADFLDQARMVEPDQEIQKSVGRGERPAAYEDVVYALQDGEISPVIASDDGYWVVKCVSSYDEEATLDRKQKLSLQRKNRAFREVYDVFAAENPVELRGDVWNEDVLSEGSGSTTTNFFGLYHEYWD